MSSWDTLNRGSENYIGVGEYNNHVDYIARGLVKFDFSSLGKVAVSAVSLKLYLQYNYTSNNRIQHVYRCTKNWSESQSSWTIYSTGNNWSTAGGDWNSTSLGSLSLGSASVGWKIFTLNTSIIQQMINGSLDNYGFLLKKETELNDSNVFGSSEGSYSPQLELTYTTVRGLRFQPIYIG